MDAQKIAQRLYESFDSDDLCEHPEIVDAVEDLADEYEDLKTENAKLRELAGAVKEFVEDTHCEDCPCRCECDDNNHVFCNDFSYHAFAAMRDLGIEVDDE